MKKISFFFLLFFTICNNLIFSQGHRTDSVRWPAFTFKVNMAANMNFGLRKKNFHNTPILRTPPAFGPELQVLFGLRLKEYASVYVGGSYGLIPIHLRYKFEGSTYYIENYEFDASYYFLALNIYSIPISFEQLFPIKNKHHILTEIGIVANYNATNSYYTSYGAVIGDYPAYFKAEIQDNGGLKWYPSGFFKIGYLKSFKKFGAISSGLRLNYSAAILGRGKYSFHGFEGDAFFNGDLLLPTNSLAFDISYHFRHSNKRKKKL